MDSSKVRAVATVASAKSTTVAHEEVAPSVEPLELSEVVVDEANCNRSDKSLAKSVFERMAHICEKTISC